MSRFRDYKADTGMIEMNHFEADPVYYNSIPGQREAISPSNSDYELVLDEDILSQESNSYVNTMIKQPGDRPIFESLGYEYEDTLTIRKAQQPTAVPTRAPPDKYHDYEDNLLAEVRDQCRREGHDYEDMPDPVRHRPPVPTLPSKTRVQEEPVRPMRKEEKAKGSKKYGACCVRGLLLWSALLLMLVIVATVFIALQQNRMNALEQRCNMTVPFSFVTS